MTSVLAAQPLTLSTDNLNTPIDTSGLSPINSPSFQRISMTNGEEEKNRGRRKTRPNNQAKDAAGGNMSPVDGVDGAEGHSSGTEGTTRKRRRSRKGLDKKFECPHEGCGKSYSRAEHL